MHSIYSIKVDKGKQLVRMRKTISAHQWCSWPLFLPQEPCFIDKAEPIPTPVLAVPQVVLRSTKQNWLPLLLCVYLSYVTCSVCVCLSFWFQPTQRCFVATYWSQPKGQPPLTWLYFNECLRKGKALKFFLSSVSEIVLLLSSAFCLMDQNRKYRNSR